MAKDKRAPRTSTVEPDGDVPVVGMREPCPCGSGRRYKACHGREASAAGSTLVRRPFAGLADEADWVALRELVPSATSPLTLAPEYAERLDGRPVTLATVLPMAWPALVRVDGEILLGLQTATGGGDPSRDIAEALLRALDSEPGEPVPPMRIAARTAAAGRARARLVARAHGARRLRRSGSTAPSTRVRMSPRRWSGPTPRSCRRAGSRASTPAYWCRIGPKEHLRWVQPYDEEPLLDALARLHARGEDTLGTGTRLIGTFRAHGLLVPVWDLVPGTEAPEIEEPAAEFAVRLGAAVQESGDLTEPERRARAGLANRQVTLR